MVLRGRDTLEGEVQGIMNETGGGGKGAEEKEGGAGDARDIGVTAASLVPIHDPPCAI